MAIPVYEGAVEKSHRAAVRTDCRTLYNALMTYKFDYDKFPSEDDFDLETLAPLSTEGYYGSSATFTTKLLDDQLLVYLAPDVDGADTQFIVIAQTKINPSNVFAIVYTNIIEETEGWVDGVYLITADELEEAGDDLDGPAEAEPAS
jgi:hypothetical protein